MLGSQGKGLRISLFLLNFATSRPHAQPRRTMPIKLPRIVAQSLFDPRVADPGAAGSSRTASAPPPGLASRAATRATARTALGLSAAAAVAFLFAGVAAFGTVSDSPFPPSTQTVERALAPAIEVLDQEDSAAYVQEERFRRGDTLAALLDRLGVDDTDISRLLISRTAMQSLAALRPGMALQARTNADGILRQLSFLAPRDQFVAIEPVGEDFRVNAHAAEVVQQIQMKSGQIRSSLFAASDAAGIPDSVAMQMADIFGGDIDFQRDLRRGDHFTVVYEMATLSGRPLRAGRVLATEFVNQGRALRAVWFPDGQGKGGYYTPEGKNLRKAFLRSPLEFSRITSGFALRFHPILQQWRVHKGIDYGAPTGTRVKATGDGVVEFTGREGGYGNLVVVRHSGGYSTRYAHLSGFASGIRRGARVAQGDILGFVGQTGWATGPHLHYEFRVNDQYRNPLTMAFPAAEPIRPERLAAFRSVADPMAARLDVLRTTNLAALE
jgi:murein DD-endopeptidase MepM/ murein hydrolase activator NlpD